MTSWLVHLATLVLAPPLLLGVIGRTKALFAGRRGAPILQPYRDLARLLRKGAVYSRTTTPVFRLGAVVPLASALVAGLLVPLASAPAPLGFAGDVIAFALLLGLGRFFAAAAALDTGSSFEGMGASREASFGSLAEPGLLLTLGVVTLRSGSLSLGPAFETLSRGAQAPVLALACAALGALLLAENARIPVDDPATHLELTMIHEAMVLDHSGPDLALILEASAVKLFLYAALLLHLCLPLAALPAPAGLALLLAGALLVAALIGVVESTMARLRLKRVPQFLIAASCLAAVAAVILLAGEAR